MDSAFDLDKLKVDEAYLNISTNSNEWLYSLASNCIRCPYQRIQKLQKYGSNILKISTAHTLKFKIFDKDLGDTDLNSTEKEKCLIEPENIGAFGIYSIEVNNNSCSFNTVQSPENINLAFLYVVCLLVLAYIGIRIMKRMYKRYIAKDDESISHEEEQQKELTNTKQRLKSLDTFRGLTIALMIFVNSGGGEYEWIEHATWNGLHLADIVFPCFLWIMGVCIPISIKSQIMKNISKRIIFQNIVIRAIKLFLIGVCLNSANGPSLETLRIMGVLQRFGVAYLVVATMCLFLMQPNIVLPQDRFKRIFYDIFSISLQWFIIVIIITVHLLAVFCYPVPGCPKGYMGPGGLHDMGQYENCTGGVVGYLDRVILNENHMYRFGTAKSTYKSLTFDPEGLFGCLLSIVQAFIGVQCGFTLLTFPEWRDRVKRFLLWGIGLGVIAGVLCEFKSDDGLIPINKNMWSLSYVCLTAGIAYLSLTICYLLLDVKSIWKGSPFIYAGMNAIVLYVGHSVMHKILPWHWRFDPMNTHLILLIESLWNTALWLIIAYYMYLRRIFITV